MRFLWLLAVLAIGVIVAIAALVVKSLETMFDSYDRVVAMSDMQAMCADWMAQDEAIAEAEAALAAEREANHGH